MTDLFTFTGEWCVLVLWSSLRSRWRLGPGGLAFAWMVLFTLELFRTAGRLLTAADPQLYDLWFLAEHLVILVSDLWGPLALPTGVLALLCILLAVGVGVRFLLLPVPDAADTRRFALGTTVAALVLAPFPGDTGGRWVTPDWVANVQASLRTWETTQQSITLDPYGPLQEHALVHRPDIGFYVVESYGRVLSQTRSLRSQYYQLLNELAPGLDAQGFHVASGWATATVSGGRSWISDASVLMGIGMGHQSTWTQIQPHTDRFTHLPAWLEANGYTTVVSRPKDRERLGLEIRDDFGWDHTVFADELSYEGTLIGWGGIPDQYSLGYVHTQALPTLEPPRMLFFHGVSAHGPWDTIPVLAPSWQEAASQDHAAESHTEMSAKGTVLRQAKRYGDALDHGGPRLPGRKFPELRRTYFEAITYSLRATIQSMSDLPPASGHLIVIYGDHQPPFIARPNNFDVPVHILATNPDWLAPFLASGFTPGLRPKTKARAIPITGLYPLLARALTDDPLSEVPTGIALLDLASRATTSGAE